MPVIMARLWEQTSADIIIIINKFCHALIQSCHSGCMKQTEGAGKHHGDVERSKKTLLEYNEQCCSVMTAFTLKNNFNCNFFFFFTFAVIQPRSNGL